MEQDPPGVHERSSAPREFNYDLCSNLIRSDTFLASLKQEVSIRTGACFC